MDFSLGAPFFSRATWLQRPRSFGPSPLRSSGIAASFGVQRDSNRFNELLVCALASRQGFGGGRTLSIGVPTIPTTTSPYAGNVLVKEGVSVGNAEFTVGGLGDVTFDNQGTALGSTRVVNVVAIGDDSVFPGLVNHSGGEILDTDPNPGAPPVLDAPEVNLIAQGRVGASNNALEVRVGSTGQVNFVTGAENVFINTVPPGRPVNNACRTVSLTPSGNTSPRRSVITWSNNR